MNISDISKTPPIKPIHIALIGNPYNHALACAMARLKSDKINCGIITIATNPHNDNFFKMMDDIKKEVLNSVGVPAAFFNTQSEPIVGFGTTLDNFQKHINKTNDAFAKIKKALEKLARNNKKRLTEKRAKQIIKNYYGR